MNIIRRMKPTNPPNRFCKSAVVLVILIFFIPGCFSITELGVKTASVEKTSREYNVVYRKKGYSYYIPNFISQKNQLVISDVSDIYVIGLNAKALVRHLKMTELTKITSSHVSDSGDYLFLFTPDDFQAWDTSNWKLTKQIKIGKYFNRLSGFSDNEEFLYFDGALWSGSTFEKIYEFGDASVPNDYDFSSDNRYFLSASHGSGILIIDIDNKQLSNIRYRKKGVSQISFRDNKSFYASYGAKLDISQGGYLPRKLGLFKVEKKHQLRKFSPSSRISCWVNSPGYGLLVSLHNGDIFLLNSELDIQQKWHIDDYIRVCSSGNTGEIWLGGDKTGLYKADLVEGVLSHEYVTDNTIFKLKISPDHKYLGIEELLPGQRQVTVLSLDQNL